MTDDPAARNNPDVMGGPEPDEEDTDLLGGTEPSGDVMHRPTGEHDKGEGQDQS